jgi:hypothetical protein
MANHYVQKLQNFGAEKVAAGEIKSTVVDDWFDPSMFSAACDAIDAGGLDAWFAKQLSTRPFWAPPKASDSEMSDERDARAGNVTALARVCRRMPADEFREWCATNSIDLNKIGKPAPKAPDSGASGARKDQSKNPWSRESWNLTKQGSIVTGLGLAKAGEMAAAVGCRVGSTRPNPDF